jgi:type 1 glutamine amidotransferase
MAHLNRLGLAAVLAVLFIHAPTPAQAPPSAAPQQAPRKKVLVLTHAALTKHASVPVAEKALPELGELGGFEVTIKSDGRETTGRTSPEDLAKMNMSFLTRDYLAQFDGLLMFTNGNLPLTQDQKQSLVDFVRDGKGIVGVHCATVTQYDYPAYGEMMGAYYLRSIFSAAQFPKRFAVLKVEDTTHPATRMLGPSWPFLEEYYMFGTKVYDPATPTENVSAVGALPIPLAFSRDRVKVLLSLDMARTDTTGMPFLTKNGDYPQSWYRTFGKGRSFYTSLGHHPETWGDPVFGAHFIGGMRWALGLEN